MIGPYNFLYGSNYWGLGSYTHLAALVYFGEFVLIAVLVFPLFYFVCLVSHL